MDRPGAQERLKSSDAAPRAVEAIANCIRRLLPGDAEESNKVIIVSTGPMTNIALFVSVYPDLLQYVEQFVFMGGGVGLGNRSAVAGTLALNYFKLSGSHPSHDFLLAKSTTFYVTVSEFILLLVR